MKASKSFFILALIMFASTATFSQKNSDSYSTAIGVKMYPGSISLKKSLNGTAYLEGLGAFWSKGFRATLLYEMHNDIGGINGLRWYYGGGGHLGFYNNNYYTGSTLIGLDGVLGLDYKIQGAPLNLSLDWQPSFEFGSGAGFEGWGGLGIRFTF